MPILLTHLGAGRHGETEAVEGEHALLGSGPASDVRFAVDLTGLPAEEHAELVVKRGDLVVRDLGSPAGTLVNGFPVGEMALAPADVVELGPGGPRLRARLQSPSRALSGEHRGKDSGPRNGAFAPARGLERHLHGTRPARPRSPRRVVAALAAAALLLSVAALVWGTLEKRRTRREIGGLRGQIEQDRSLRISLLRAVGAERQRAAREQERMEAETRRQILALKTQEEELRERLAGAEADASRKGDEIAALERRLEETHARQKALADERSSAERLLRQVQGGVGFVEGTYTLLDAEGAPLTMEAPGGKSVPVGEVYYSGTGFLVSASGLVLTNRHVAEPWWKDERVEALRTTGATPVRRALRIYFPGVPDPFDLSVVRVSEAADVALLSASLGGRKVPVLPLQRKRQPATGQPVLLLGYPAGLDALLARLDDSVVAELVTATGGDPEKASRELARRGMVRPLATQGHLGDVLPNQLVYDAQTTIGGSGGPILDLSGEVIGVNAAILSGFGGANFGVPVRYALDLLPRSRRSSR